MLPVRLAKEAHFRRAAEDKEVSGQRSIIRLDEPAPRRGRAECTPEPRTSARAVLRNHHDSGILLNHYHLHQNPLTGLQTEGRHLRWLARLLGYVCTAVKTACANGSPVDIVSGAHLNLPDDRSWPGALNIVGRLASQAVLPIQSWNLRQARPRAPPP